MKTLFANIPLSTAALLISASAALATPSGLDNINTADTVPQGTAVVQTYSTMGENRQQDFNLGFKTGIDAKIVQIEVGADSHIVPGAGGPVVAQAKVAYAFGQGLPTVALGAANIGFDQYQRDRTGDVFGYAVASENFGFFRLHGGCGYQQNDALPFVGIDKTFRIPKKPAAGDAKSAASCGGGKGGCEGKGSCEGKSEVEMRDLITLKADAIEQHNHSWLSSAGFLLPICKYFILESWANFPSDGTTVSVTIKGDFVVKF